ncbi:MAG: hypothetical protein LBC29_04585, partial [Propionibacteriaceae bacterium]|nr:hypothetical protein [Propionibacteriaceae bacterium]
MREWFNSLGGTVAGHVLRIAGVVLGVVAGGIVLTFTALVAFADGNTTITLPAVLDRDSLPVTVRGYSAEDLSKELYALDVTGTIKDGQLSVEWEPPAGYSRDDVYIEIVPRETLNPTSEHFDSSCAYYVPAHSAGVIPRLLGWNELGESQLVGCVSEGQQHEFSSYVELLSSTQHVDTNTDTTYSAVSGGGLILDSGNKFSLLTSCAAGEVLKWDAVSAVWGCAADSDSSDALSNYLLISTFNTTMSGVTDTLNGIDDRLNGVDDTLGGVGDRLDGVDDTLGGVGDRLDGVDDTLGGVGDRLDGV